MYRFDFTYQFAWWQKNWSFENIGLIDQLIKKMPAEKPFLETLHRRLRYSYVISKQLGYLTERYKWNEAPELFDYYISLFEQNVCMMCEILQLTLNFYTLKKKNYSGPIVIDFKDIDDFLLDPNNGLPKYHNITINDSLFLSILMYIRNFVVHGKREISYQPNDNKPLILIHKIPPEDRRGVLKTVYLDDVYSMIKEHYKKIWKKTQT